jgi:alkylation response protein AidB-like acyl-CoA dehydrogenase
MSAPTIRSPDDPALGELCAQLAHLANDLDTTGHWPAEQLRLCGAYGVYQWFLEPEWGGQAWSDEEIVRGYLALSSACLTTTFILTQRSGACRRIASSSNTAAQAALLPELASGARLSTVGISHLTTSRQHLARPVLCAEGVPGGLMLNGMSPWVTGAAHADSIVVGATLTVDGQVTPQQLLVALPSNLPGVTAAEPAQLVGVSASHTGALHLDNVFVEARWLIAGPVENVMATSSGAGSGGYQTSTLALGLARAAIDYLATQAAQRESLLPPLEALQQEHETLTALLLAAVRQAPACEDPLPSKDGLRQSANSLALRSAQASLAAAKGAGYVVGHPAGRWCREALFFLVWSCPQPVLTGNLCELAGIASE